MEVNQMSDFTTELRFICETEAGYSESKGYNDVEEIISLARPKIFNFNYPIYNEEHRAELETKIIKHYYTREIGFETYGLWKLKLNTKLNEIMPYYNELYRSADLEFNPLNDVDYTKTHEGSNTFTSENQSSINNIGNSQRDITTHETSASATDTTRWDKYSDTPQGSLQNIENDTYLTSARKNTEDYDGSGVKDGHTDDDVQYSDSKATTGSTEDEGSDEFTERITGKIGTYSYAKLLKDYREQILNIDLMIINDLSSLFMYLW